MQSLTVNCPTDTASLMAIYSGTMHGTTWVSDERHPLDKKRDDLLSKTRQGQQASPRLFPIYEGTWAARRPVPHGKAVRTFTSIRRALFIL